MADLSSDPDSARDLAYSILRGRDAGLTYRSIADDLGLSPGKAQHLAKDLLAARQEAARALTRPPTRHYRGHRPDPGEVLGRLRDDMLAIEPLLGCYPDEDGNSAETIATGDEVFFDAAKAIRRVLADPDSASVAEELASIEDAFTGLLVLAHGVDPTLREEVDAGEVLATFHLDLGVLAEETGSDLSDLAELWKNRERSLRPTGEPPALDCKRPIGKEERRRRDEAIVRARLSGTPATDVARAFKVSTRQVRRVMERHRDESFGAAPAAIAAVEEAAAGITREIEDLEGGADQAVSFREKLRLAETIAGLYDGRVAIYRRAGMLTPDSFRVAEAAATGARIDQVPVVNRAIRKTLSRHGVDEKIIDEATDQVIAASGIRMPEA